MANLSLDKELKQLSNIYEMVVEFFVTYSFQLLGAILIVLIGWFVASKCGNFILRFSKKKNVDVTLAAFSATGVKLLILTVFIIIALGKIGISVGPFVAALGAASLGVGLAIQGPLSNYGAGLNLILARPFVVGDTISVQGVDGVVEVIKLAYTVLSDEDGVQITIPNKHIVGEILHNSHSDTLIELSIGISYADDPKQAIEKIQNTLANFELSSKERLPLVGISEFADSSINIGVRFWAPTKHRFEAHYAANAAIFETLKANNITIPFPQRELRILEKTS